MKDTKVIDAVWGFISFLLLIYILFHISEVTDFLDALFKWRPPK